MTNANQRIHPDRFYVTNGERTTGPYRSKDRAYRRKTRFNDSNETDGTWMVVTGDLVQHDDDIPLPK